MRGDRLGKITLMNKIDHLDVDFAALRTLRTVRDAGSFSLAAKRLDIRQSTVSHTVQRLRRVFGDPLFVPKGRGIAATERCIEIARGATRLLARYENLVLPEVFDLQTAEIDVTIAVTHQQRILLATDLVRYIRKHAPGIKVQLNYAHGDSLSDLFDDKCDILITPLPHRAGSLYRRHLFRDRYVCVVDRCHPNADRPFTMEDFSASRHVLVSYEGFCRLPYVATLEAQGLLFDAVLDLPSTSEIDEIIVGTDLVATVIERLARTCSEKVVVVEPPFDHRMDVHMYWTSRTHSAEIMRWIRDAILKVAKTPSINA